MCSNYNGIKLEPALGTLEDKIEHLSSYAHVVHTTAKQVISRRRRNENVLKMSKDEKCTCKACRNTVFHRQIQLFQKMLSGRMTNVNRPFPNYLWPLFQSESWCSSFHMKISFDSHANEN